MTQPFASSPASIGSEGHRHRADGAAGNTPAPAATEHARTYGTSQATDAEGIIAALVNQYFRCSTNVSGIFRCW